MSATASISTKELDDVSKFSKSLIWVKLIAVGPLASGKSCLVKHICESRFSSSYYPTVGVDYGFKLESIKGFDLRLHLWDFSGSSDYVEVRNELYNDADGIFLVIDPSQEKALDSVSEWMNEISKHCLSTKAKPEICLILNKNDVKSKWLVTEAQWKAVAKPFALNIYETSAATGLGIREMLTEVLHNIHMSKSVEWKKRQSYFPQHLLQSVSVKK